MQVSISRSKIKGFVTAPPSKSYTIRGLMCGSLAHGQSRIINPLGSDDTVAAVRVLRRLGVKIRQRKTEWFIEGKPFQAATGDLFCGDSAATLRFMMALGSMVPGGCRLTAGDSLSKRPVQTLVDALKQIGVSCTSNLGFPPVDVNGNGTGGGTVFMPGDISSQFVSALLLLAPLVGNGLQIKLSTPLESRPYVLMTLDIMQWFGISVAFNEKMDEFTVVPQDYRPTRYRVEGDWSSASYLLALGALNGETTVNELSLETMQGDRMILEFLQNMGADIEVKNNSIYTRQSNLKPLQADLTDCPDLLPTVAVMAAVAAGNSVLTGIARARLKESDRVQAVCDNLNRMGIKTITEENSLIVQGGRPHGAVIDSYNDHRIAMAFSLLGTMVGRTVITQAECVNKTYPEFWLVLQNLGGKVVMQ